MAAGINLSLVVNSRDAIREFSRTGESLEDVADKLQDVATESTRTGRDLENDMRDASRVIDREADDMERSFKEAFSAASKQSKDAGRDISRNTKRGMDDAESYTGEFRDEARSNFSEITSSFTGDMDSIADLAQGTLGGLAGSIAGPFGIAAGVVAAAGGLFYTQWKENAEKVEQRIQAMYDDMLESGANFLSQDFIQQQLQEIYGKTEDAAVGWDKLQEIVRTTGVQESVVALAFAGDATARQELLDGIIAKQDELRGTIKDQSVEERTAIGDTISVMGKWSDEINGLSAQTDDAASRADGFHNAVQRLNTELYQVPKDVRSKITVTYDDAVARAKLDGFISDVERRRINLTIDPRLTNFGRSTL